MSLNDVLTQLIESPKPRALVLQGTWGRGKTHLWKMIWADYADRYQKQGKKLTRYAYVSLFGVNSLDELKQAIFESNEELLAHQNSAIDNESFIKKTKNYLTKKHFKRQEARRSFGQQCRYLRGRDVEFLGKCI